MDEPQSYDIFEVYQGATSLYLHCLLDVSKGTVHSLTFFMLYVNVYLLAYH